jgi:hypothetical protein
VLTVVAARKSSAEAQDKVYSVIACSELCSPQVKLPPQGFEVFNTYGREFPQLHSLTFCSVCSGSTPTLLPESFNR